MSKLQNQLSARPSQEYPPRNGYSNYPNIPLAPPPMTIADPKPPSINPRETPHGNHGPKQGNPCPNSKTKAQPLPDKNNSAIPEIPKPPHSFPANLPYPNWTPIHPSPPSMRALTGSTAQNRGIPDQTQKTTPSPTRPRRPTQKSITKPPQSTPSPSPGIKAEPKTPVFNLSNIPHGSHIPNQGNSRPNSKTNSQPPSDKTTQTVKDTPTPFNIPQTPFTYNSNPNSTFITLYESPHRIHGPKQGTPCPNYKLNSQYDLAEKTHSEKDHQSPQSSHHLSP